MKNIEDATLDDVGEDVLISVYKGMRPTYVKHPRRVIAMIKAPRGRIILFDTAKRVRGWENDKSAIQAEAINLFMQEHREDK